MHVCHLKKALYGLKQAPQAWYHELQQFLLSIGFINTKLDTPLFIYTHMHLIMYLLVYVDDLILIGNNDCAFTQFTKQFVTKFSIKDLDSLSYFLSVELILFFHGVLLSQCKYIHDLLEKVDMLISKDVHTPMSPNQGLSLHDNITLIVATHY